MWLTLEFGVISILSRCVPPLFKISAILYKSKPLLSARVWASNNLPKRHWFLADNWSSKCWGATSAGESSGIPGESKFWSLSSMQNRCNKKKAVRFTHLNLSLSCLHSASPAVSPAGGLLPCHHQMPGLVLTDSPRVEQWKRLGNHSPLREGTEAFQCQLSTGLFETPSLGSFPFLHNRFGWPILKYNHYLVSIFWAFFFFLSVGHSLSVIWVVKSKTPV